jgi:hypothetical protein
LGNKRFILSISNSEHAVYKEFKNSEKINVTKHKPIIGSTKICSPYHAILDNINDMMLFSVTVALLLPNHTVCSRSPRPSSTKCLSKALIKEDADLVRLCKCP